MQSTWQTPSAVLHALTLPVFFLPRSPDLFVSFVPLCLRDVANVTATLVATCARMWIEAERER